MFLSLSSHEAARAIKFSEVRSLGYLTSSTASDIELSETDERQVTTEKPTRRISDGFIPLSMTSSSEDETSDGDAEDEMYAGNFSMTEKDFISLD